MRSNFMNKRNLTTMFGGYCGVVAGLCFLFGMLLYFYMLMDHRFGDIREPFEYQVRFMEDNALLIYGWYFIIYIVFGLALLGFQIGILPRLRAGGLRQAGVVLGYLWVGLTISTGMLANVGNTMVLQLVSVDSKAAMFLWHTLQMVINGFGGGNELVGGVWMIILGATMKPFGVFDNSLKVWGVAVGLIGVLSSVPGWTMLGGIFGMGCIIWFVITGGLMIKHTGINNA